MTKTMIAVPPEVEFLGSDLDPGLKCTDFYWSVWCDFKSTDGQTNDNRALATPHTKTVKSMLMGFIRF